MDKIVERDDFNTKTQAFMTAKRQREIVIEFERIQLIRKRAKTHFRTCDECGYSSDFISLREAAALFGITLETLSGFIHTEKCHCQTSSNASDTDVCLASLLACMRAKGNGSNIRLLEV